MSASLVGSEMCIRDSDPTGQGGAGAPRPTYPGMKPPQPAENQPLGKPALKAGVGSWGRWSRTPT
eukprot:6835651-Alexandrium_andersonii.AAC.1